MKALRLLVAALALLALVAPAFALSVPPVAGYSVVVAPPYAGDTISASQLASQMPGGTFTVNADGVTATVTTPSTLSVVLGRGWVVTSTDNSTAPTISAGCSGSGSGVVGNSHYFTLTTQTSGAATTCTLKWTIGAFLAAPRCVFGDANASITPVAYSAGSAAWTATTAATQVVDFVSASGAVINGICF